MNQTIVYVPIILYGGNNNEHSAISCGCFVNKNDVYKAIIRKLVKNNFIPLNYFVRWLGSIKNNKDEEEYDDEDDDEDDDDKLDEELFNLDEKTLTVEQFIEYLLKKVDNNYDNLVDICIMYGDLYYTWDKEGWRVQINEHILRA
jgi:hypothetical protein